MMTLEEHNTYWKLALYERRKWQWPETNNFIREYNKKVRNDLNKVYKTVEHVLTD